ncbi:MAG TPA: hypothetical protein VN966_02910 [Candidatus Bathyarchaeia archaeon]|nr:hypothetical protein [Candidatus Bathyarchaeia archaeon]
MVALGDIHEESALRSLLIDEECLVFEVGHEGGGREAVLVFGSLDDLRLVAASVWKSSATTRRWGSAVLPCICCAEIC